jgi:uncharacterized protein YcgI (DUF1989 family)
VSAPIIIEAKSARAVSVRRGQVLRIEAIDGGQVADLVCFSDRDHKEKFSQAKSRIRNWSIRVTTGFQLVSNRDNVMLTIGQDTVGVHDVVFCPCHSYVYEHMFGVGPRNGCFENLAAAVAATGISADDLPDPVNIFMSTGIKDNGELYVAATPSKKGDFIELRAEMDCLVAVSACADDVTDCNHGQCKRISLQVT